MRKHQNRMDFLCIGECESAKCVASTGIMGKCRFFISGGLEKCMENYIYVQPQ